MNEIESELHDIIIRYSYMPIMIKPNGGDLCTKNKWLKEQILELIKKALKERDV